MNYIKNIDCVNKIIPGSNHDITYEEYKEKRKNEGKRIRSKSEFNSANETYECDCGSELVKNGKALHEKTKKHLNYISNC